MSQKLTLAVYLEQKGQKAKALKRIEAEAFGIPYPLQAGWPGRHGGMEITPQMLEQIATSPRVKIRPAALTSLEEEGELNLRPDCDVSYGRQADVMRPARFPGFVARLALRHRAQKLPQQRNDNRARAREAKALKSPRKAG